MASEILTPNGSSFGDPADWTGDHLDVDEGIGSTDGDTTVMETTTTTATAELDFTSPALAGPFNKIKFFVIVRLFTPSVGGEELTIQPEVNSIAIGTPHSISEPAITDSYSSFSAEWLGAWTAAELASLKMLIDAVDATSGFKFTTVDAEVTEGAAIVTSPPHRTAKIIEPRFAYVW